MNTQIQTIGIVGSGTMGAGIAQVCAMAGYEVLLFDLKQDILVRAIQTIENNLNKGIERGKISEEIKINALDKISVTTELDSLIADLIIEAAIEKLDTKQTIFTELEKLNKDTTILSTNTSSIPVTRIGSALENKGRFIGIHFFNPAHLMKLVEVIPGADTDQHILNEVVDFVKTLGKQPVVASDSPGFIVNRVARHFYVESLKVVEDGVADFETVDRLMENVGFKMGPFRLMDLIGVDTNFSVTNSMYESFHFDTKFRPNRIQEQKVDAGHFGRKSGKGFYTYD